VGRGDGEVGFRVRDLLGGRAGVTPGTGAPVVTVGGIALGAALGATAGNTVLVGTLRGCTLGPELGINTGVRNTLGTFEGATLGTGIGPPWGLVPARALPWGPCRWRPTELNGNRPSERGPSKDPRSVPD
jgi:hypothetical protein